MTDGFRYNLSYSNPPTVDFSRPVGPIAKLTAQRARMNRALADMESGLADIRAFSAEGRFNAEVAIVWAGVLIIADGLKEGLSTMDRRAKLLFSAQDKAIVRAEKLLKLFGQKGLAKRDDALAGVDDSLKDAVTMLQTIKTSQKLIKDAGIGAPKKAERAINVGLMLTGDVILLLDGFKQRERVTKMGNAQEAQTQLRINHIRKQIRELDAEFSRLMLLGEQLSRTA